MTAQTKISGAWKDVSAISTKVSGAWKDVSEGYTKISGTWEQFFAPSAAGPAYDLLETEILTGTQASVTFSSLNSTYGADYQHLQIRAVARGALSDTAGSLEMTFNGVGGTSYAYHRLAAEYEGGVFAVRSKSNTSAAFMFIGRTTGATAAANTFGPSVIDIFDPFETTKNTTARGLGGVTEPGDQRILLTSGLFNNTAAVSSITLTVTSGFVTGSRFSIYGLRSA